MQVVYVDTLFFLNLSVDYLLLLLTARIAGVYVQRRYLLLGAAVGAILSVLLFFPTLSEAAVLLLRGGTLAATVLPAFGKTPVRRWPRLMGTFLLLTTVLAGVIMALAQQHSGIGLRNGSLYAEITGAVMLISFTVMFLLSGLVLGKGRAVPGRHWREIQAQTGKGNTTFRVLTDSGNLLRDPVSGRPVIVAESATLAPLLGLEPSVLAKLFRDQSPDQALERLRQDCGMAFWLLPVRTVTQNGLMVVFRPEKLQVDGRVREDYLLGITDGKIDVGGDCCGLMGV